MTFQIHALAAEPFAPLFALPDSDLAAHRARRVVVAEKPGTPCRVSLEDAEVGETVLLIHHVHQPADTPYHAGHAIFVRQGVAQARPAPGTVPAALASRLISMRLFDAQNMMLGAEVLEGADLPAALERAFENDTVAYIHLHNARPGCFAASVTRGG